MLTIDDFLEFEKKSNIFSIKNATGIYLWDIFRYFVCGQLFSTNSPSTNNKRNFLWVINCFITAIEPLWFFYFDRKQYNNLFFLASRNQYGDSFIDQNQFDTYKVLTGQKNLIIETWGRNKSNYYQETPIAYSHLVRMIHLLYHPNISNSDKKCISEVYATLKENFGELSFSEHKLISLLKTFYTDVYLWQKILRRHKIKRVFLTQNGIQKGLFYVAKQMNIPLYEFQHGIIGKAHTAYSYPTIEDLNNYIYTPYKFLTLSDYWCKSFYCPMLNQTIGNNYFSKPVEKVKDADKILVISADVFGRQLAIILKSAINAGVLKANNLIFKLHPNQYFEKDYYTEFFDGKVSVLTNEKSVNQLLAISKCIITVCSTAAYEALQSNTRVLIYTISMYKQMELLFDDENVFLFSNIEELKTCMDAKLPKNYELPIFFDKCNPEKIKAAIDE